MLLLYLLGGERLRPVVQDEPVFVEGLQLRRRLVALLPIWDFTVRVHGRDGPPATVGGGYMVGRRHDRAFCACSGEELREGREGGGRERERETEREHAEPVSGFRSQAIFSEWMRMPNMSHRAPTLNSVKETSRKSFSFWQSVIVKALRNYLCATVHTVCIQYV